MGGCSCGMGLELASLALCHPQGTLPACFEPRPDPGSPVEAVPRHAKALTYLSQLPAHCHTCTLHTTPAPTVQVYRQKRAPALSPTLSSPSLSTLMAERSSLPADFFSHLPGGHAGPVTFSQIREKGPKGLYSGYRNTYEY